MIPVTEAGQDLALNLVTHVHILTAPVVQEAVPTVLLLMTLVQGPVQVLTVDQDLGQGGTDLVLIVVIRLIIVVQDLVRQGVILDLDQGIVLILGVEVGHHVILRREADQGHTHVQTHDIVRDRIHNHLIQVREVIK